MVGYGSQELHWMRSCCQQGDGEVFIWDPLQKLLVTPYRSLGFDPFKLTHKMQKGKDFALWRQEPTHITAECRG